MKVKSESEVAQSCPILSNPMDCSPPGSSVHGIFQARVLEWGAIAFSDHFSRFQICVLEWLLSKRLEIASVGEDVEERGPLCTVGEGVNWCSH